MVHKENIQGFNKTSTRYTYIYIHFVIFKEN